MKTTLLAIACMSLGFLLGHLGYKMCSKPRIIVNSPLVEVKIVMAESRYSFGGVHPRTLVERTDNNERFFVKEIVGTPGEVFKITESSLNRID